MPRVDAFHSIKETKKPLEDQVHHNNRGCVSGREIPQYEHRFGTGEYGLCDHCQRLNQQGADRSPVVTQDIRATPWLPNNSEGAESLKFLDFRRNIAGVPSGSVYLTQSRPSSNGEESSSLRRGRTMADESKLTDAILAAYNEEYANFMKSFMIAAELVPDLRDKELVEYARIGEKIDADHVEQKKQRRIMIELEQVSSTAAQKLEYLARLLAVTEQYTERLRGLTEEFGNLIRSQRRKKEIIRTSSRGAI